MTDKRARAAWAGYVPAITTPFDDQLALDLRGLGRLVEWMHAQGMHGLVVAGTTGEWTSLSDAERCALFGAVGQQVGGKLPLVAGCTAFTPATVLQLAHCAHRARFDAILVTPPPYVRPNEQEVLNFYTTISRSSPLPICVYNWPPGTGLDLPLELLQRLAALDNVVAIKQSTGDLRRFVDTFFQLRDTVRVFGHSMDEHGLALLEARGGDGTMGAGGVLGRVQPDFYNHLWRGEIELARHCGRKDRVILEEWYTSELVGRFGSGPSIMKAALDARGLPGGRVRPPLLEVSRSDAERIAATLRELTSA